MLKEVLRLAGPEDSLGSFNFTINGSKDLEIVSDPHYSRVFKADLTYQRASIHRSSSDTIALLRGPNKPGDSGGPMITCDKVGGPVLHGFVRGGDKRYTVLVDLPMVSLRKTIEDVRDWLQQKL